MIIEQLISNYLDGELTTEQDQELRRIVASDPEARKTFDEAVLIHIALRCEDDTQVPSDLRSSVLDKVDELAESDDRFAAYVADNRLPRRKSNTTSRVAALVAVLLFAWIPVRDTLFVGGSRQPNSQPTSQPIAAVQQAVVVPSSTEASIQTLAHTVENEQGAVNADAGTTNNHEAIPNSSSFVNEATIAANHQTDAIEPEVVMPTLSSVFGGSGSGGFGSDLAMDRAPTTNTSDETSLGPRSSPVLENTQPTYITVSTSIATGIAASIASASEIQQVAASIGFGVSANDVVGLEVGSTRYSMVRSTTIAEQTGASVARAAMMYDPEGGNGKLSSPGSSAGAYDLTEYSVQQNELSVWGSAFYERKLIDLSEFSVKGRAGAGVATDGVIGFGRLTGEVNLTSAISMVVGAEARAMPLRVGPLPGIVSGLQYGTVVTALTGIHVRF